MIRQSYFLNISFEMVSYWTNRWMGFVDGNVCFLTAFQQTVLVRNSVPALGCFNFDDIVLILSINI